MNVASTNTYLFVHADVRGILGALTANRDYIEFVFMMGNLKLSQHDFFSVANVFVDISLNEPFNEICGYIEENSLIFIENSTYLELSFTIEERL